MTGYQFDRLFERLCSVGAVLLLLSTVVIMWIIALR